MKKYLFGLGAMLVGAGLMFVLMHGEVMAIDLTKEIDKEEDELSKIIDGITRTLDEQKEVKKQANAIVSVVDREDVPEPFVCSYDPYMPSMMRTGTEGLRITHCKTKITQNFSLRQPIHILRKASP